MTHFFTVISCLIIVTSAKIQTSKSILDQSNQTAVTPSKAVPKTQYYDMILSSGNVFNNNVKKYTILMNGKFLGN